MGTRDNTHSNEGKCMNIEWERLKSFERFPSEPSVSFIRLAQDGFFYDGQGSDVVCFCCHATYRPKDWGDNIRAIHKTVSPACVFVNGGHTNNVPIRETNFNLNNDAENNRNTEYTSGASSDIDRSASGGPQDLVNREDADIRHKKENITTRSSNDEIPQGNDEYSRKTDTEKVAAENEKLRSEIMCKICMDRDACVVFLPCGHMATCEVCSKALRKCAMCRTVIRRTIKSIIY
ncbi:E3 ubiquitin-protein ligase XIAP-like [Dreissena polymorpha]|uniref:E3 ubiquitin-protein ligase XIAP-like n=1 Tax=Dreissena polymorpha TaxID=45954 RepID=UPI0022641832|nr:E3 ubiquitin-protein ligase XIAP-like [Dreissena polymorpha]